MCHPCSYLLPNAVLDACNACTDTADVIGFVECDEAAGEVLIGEVSADFHSCQNICEGEQPCQSFTHLRSSDGCKLYSTPCKKTLTSQIGLSLRLVKPTSTTPKAHTTGA